MNKLLLILLVAAFAITAFAQSGRMPEAAIPVEDVPPPAVKLLFDEANGYTRKKALEFEEKKIRFNEELLEATKLEQRQLAARLAASAGERKSLATEDLYYLGMLHWIAENYTMTAETLSRYSAAEDADKVKAQTARSIAIVSLAKLRKLDNAEAVLKTFLAAELMKLTERSRVHSELAKAYQTAADFSKMAPHADEAFRIAVLMLKDQASHARGLDEIIDGGMLAFEAQRDLGNTKKADAALDQLKAIGAETQSAGIYYYATDQKIRYMIESGRKAAAMEAYLQALIDAGKELTNKPTQADVQARLRRREKHYKLLGEPAPELPAADQWFPGERSTLAGLKGKIVLLDFWATWCGPCYDAFPLLSAWHRERGGDGLVILGLTRYYGNIAGVKAARPAEIEHLKTFREKEDLPYTFVVYGDQSAQMMYAATGLPTAVLIDRKGIIRYIETGSSPSRLAELQSMVLKLLAEK